MVTPEVIATVEGRVAEAQALQAQFADVEQRPIFRKVFFGTCKYLGKLMNSQVVISDETSVDMQAHSAQDGQLSGSLHHPSGFDIPNHGHAVASTPALHPLKDDGLVIAGKSELFKKLPMLGQIVGKFIARCGARPVFRDKFFFGGLDVEKEELDSKFEYIRKSINRSQNAGLAEGVNEDGLHHGRYELGTRTSDQRKTGKIKPGTLKLIEQLDHPENLMIFTMATKYTKKVKLPKFLSGKSFWAPWDTITLIENLPAEQTSNFIRKDTESQEELEENRQKLQDTLQGTVTRVNSMELGKTSKETKLARLATAAVIVGSIGLRSYRKRQQQN